VERHCDVGKDTESFLMSAMKALGITARGHHRILKVARTIADLAGSEGIESPHIAEAVQYRTLDRKLFAG
jgi:magnesium chelatase family protein